MNLNFIPFPTLSTDRLILRQLSANDAENIHELRSDPEVNKMLGRNTSTGVNDALIFIANIDTMTANTDGLYWVVALKDGGQFAGTICLYNFDCEKQGVELGYELLPAYQGKGLATEAVKEIIHYAFDTIAAVVVTATPAEVNTPSIKLLEKLSFQLNGSFTVGPDDAVLLDYRLSNSNQH